MAQTIAGQTYVFDANPAELNRLTLEFDGSAEAVAHVASRGDPVVSQPIGLDGVFRFSTGSDGRPQGLRGYWADEQTFFLEYDGITNNDHTFFQFRFVGDRVEVQAQETAHEVGAAFEGRLKN
ncbi:hypothetical protein [Promineifilum sp.]|uniref:hypothetical protein n=1 Tax=Promineifilum sp. TaxID=2664178 RepID=UPI0035B1A490